MWFAFVLGILGFLVLLQDPFSAAPLLLGSAVLGWRARPAGAAASGGGQQAKMPLAASDRPAFARIDVSAASLLRAVLVVAAAALAIVPIVLLMIAIDELPSLEHGRVYAVRAGVASLVTAYGVACLLRFRATLQPHRLFGQVWNGAVQFAVGGLGFLLAIFAAHITEQAVSDGTSLSKLAGVVAVVIILPALCLAAGGAIAFAHRATLGRRLGSRPVLRGALLAQAVGGGIAMVLVFAIAAVKATLLADPFALAAFLMPGAACGLVACAAAANARSDAPGLRRAGLGYGAVLLMLLSAQVLLAWAGALASIDAFFKSWSILIVFAPIVVPLTTALSIMGLVFGFKSFRKALMQ